MSKKEFERIEAYLTNTMTPEERAGFEAELTVNSRLASALTLYRTIEQNMRISDHDSNHDHALRQTLAELGAIYFAAGSSENRSGAKGKFSRRFLRINSGSGSAATEEKQRDKRALVRWLPGAAAAAIMGILVLGLLWSLRQTSDNAKPAALGQKPTEAKKADGSLRHQVTPDTVASPVAMAAQRQPAGGQPESDSVGAVSADRLFARHFRPDAVPETESLYLDEAFRFYERGQYTRAIAAFQEITAAPLTRGASDEEAATVIQARYYGAVSYLASGQTTKAIAELRRLADDKSIFGTKAQWYLALAYLRSGNTKRAGEVLNALAKRGKGPVYPKKANDLLKLLPKK